MWKKVSPALGSCSELFCIRDEKTEGLWVVFYSFVRRRLEQLVTTVIYQLEKENMTAKGSLLNSVSGQDRLQEADHCSSWHAGRKEVLHLLWVTTFGLFKDLALRERFLQLFLILDVSGSRCHRAAWTYRLKSALAWAHCWSSSLGSFAGPVSLPPYISH